jgi:endonuclease YncB( thermonuclease family)
MIWQRSSVYRSGQIIEVIDGDTVRLNGAVYRLALIRAGATIRCWLWRAISQSI